MEITSRSHKLEFWRNVVEEQARSGLSVRAYCAEHELSAQSFYLWRRKLQNPSVDRPSTALVPVRIVPSAAQQSSGSVQVFTPSGFTIRVDATTHPQAAAQLIWAIEFARCNSETRGESC